MSGGSGDGFRIGDSTGAVSWTGKVMVAAIIVLFVAVVFVIFLHLYARWFWRRNDQTSRRRRRHFVFNTDVDPAARRGLDTAVLQSLPVVVYQSAEFKDGLECSVCLCELADGEKARVLPKCSHGFHLECIDMWFQSNSTCPLCRSLVGSELSPAPAASAGDGDGVTAETFAFPTNVLFWGRPEGGDDNNPSSSSSARPRSHIVIDIPRPVMDGGSTDAAATANVSPSSGRVVDEMKSPTSRLDSLKRLLSREGRLAIPISPRGGGDVEQGSRASMDKP